MIVLDSVSKQHGSQILFLDASLSVFRGEKVGLVGPNGSGKSTIFRMIVGEEPPDSGQVAVERGVAIGYFSQDVGEMSGRTVLEETMAGAGEVSDAARELHALEHAMADPGRADELEALVERFGHAQARFDELGGYTLESRAREILAGLGFADDVVDGDVGKLSPADGRCAWGWREFSSCGPTRCCSTSRPTISTSNRSSGSKRFLRDSSRARS